MISNYGEHVCALNEPVLCADCADRLKAELQQLRQQRDALAGALRESLGALMPYGGNAAPKPGLIGRIRAALASLERH